MSNRQSFWDAPGNERRRRRRAPLPTRPGARPPDSASVSSGDWRAAPSIAPLRHHRPARDECRRVCITTCPAARPSEATAAPRRAMMSAGSPHSSAWRSGTGARHPCRPGGWRVRTVSQGMPRCHRLMTGNPPLCCLVDHACRIAQRRCRKDALFHAPRGSPCAERRVRMAEGSGRPRPPTRSLFIRISYHQSSSAWYTATATSCATGKPVHGIAVAG